MPSLSPLPLEAPSAPSIQLIFISSEKHSWLTNPPSPHASTPQHRAPVLAHAFSTLLFPCHTCFTVSPLDCKLQEGRTVLCYLGPFVPMPTQHVCAV